MQCSVLLHSASADMLDESEETGGGRRRSTFYVPLAENRTPSSASAVDRKMLTSSTHKRLPGSTPTSPDKVPFSGIDRQSPMKSLTPQRAPPRTKNLTKSPSQSSCTKPLLTVTKTIEGPPTPQLPTLMPIQKTSSLSASDRLRSPLLKVSTKLLSTSAQALEVINRSPASSPSKSQHSPLSLIRRSSSRKLSRSSSTILTRSSSTKPGRDNKDSSLVDLSRVPIIMIDQLPDERLLSSAGDKAQQRRHVKLEPEDDDTGVHSGMFSSPLVYII